MPYTTELRRVTRIFDVNTARYYFDNYNVEGLKYIRGYSAGVLKDFTKAWIINVSEGGRPFIEWDLINGAQATTFEDEFDRVDGAVGNGWTTYASTGGTCLIKDEEVRIVNPGSGGNLGAVDYSTIVRTAGAGVGSDENPHVIKNYFRWDANAMLEAEGFTGVFFYWDSDANGRTFCGTAIGTNVAGTTGLYAILDGTYNGSVMVALSTEKAVYLRCVLKSNTIECQYSFTDSGDDWHDHPSSPLDRSTFTAPSHYVLGRGYADSFTSTTYLRNVYAR